MSASPWAILGIEATRERADIRRAYAAKLKVTNPEDNPDGFQALRSAYERALAYAAPERPTVVVQPTAATEPEVEFRARRPRKAPPAPDADPESELDAVPTDRRREWRPPDEPEPPESPHRSRQWRPPDPVPPSAPIVRRRTHRAPPLEAAPDTVAEAEHLAARQRLQKLAVDPDTPPADLMAALKVLLTSPAMDSIDRHAATEAWLAGLIAGNAPRTDVLIEASIAFFRWDEGRVGPRSNIAGRVIARREDLRFIAGSSQTGAHFYGALQAVTRPPTWRRRLLAPLTFDLAPRVRLLLTNLRAERPGLLASLDPAAVTWWDKRLSRPYVDPASLWTLLLLPALFFIIEQAAVRADPTAPPAWMVWVGTLVVVGAGVAFRFYAILWPRILWRRRWAAQAGPLPRLGWAPALGALTLAAAIVPPTLIGGFALTAAAAVVAVWAIIVSDPDQRRTSRTPWQVRLLFSLLYLAIFWLLTATVLALPVWQQVTGPMIFAAVGFLAADATMLSAWHRELSEAGRRRVLVGLLVMVGLAGALLSFAAERPFLQPIAAVLVAGLALASRAPAATLSLGALRVRYWAAVFGWLGWIIVVTLLEPGKVRALPLQIGGYWLLTGVAITAGALLIAGRTPRRKAA